MQLLASFSSQSGDWRTIRRLDWYIAPLLNADGYAYSHHKDGVSENFAGVDNFVIHRSAQTASID